MSVSRHVFRQSPLAGTQDWSRPGACPTIVRFTTGRSGLGDQPGRHPASAPPVPPAAQTATAPTRSGLLATGVCLPLLAWRAVRSDDGPGAGTAERVPLNAAAGPIEAISVLCAAPHDHAWNHAIQHPPGCDPANREDAQKYGHFAVWRLSPCLGRQRGEWRFRPSGDVISDEPVHRRRLVGAVLGPFRDWLLRSLPVTPSKVLPSPGPYRRPITLSSDRFSNTTTTR
jgi:hypothetical protein